MAHRASRRATVVLMALAILDVLDTAAAIDIAIVIAVVSLFAWGFAAGRRSRKTLGERLLVGALSGAFGVAIAALKFALHCVPIAGRALALSNPAP